MGMASLSHLRLSGCSFVPEYRFRPCPSCRLCLQPLRRMERSQSQTSPEAQYTFSVGPLASNTYIGDLLQGRNSIVDDGIVIVDRRLSDTLEVHIQTPPAAIRGTVSATPQQLAAGVTITLVPEDARRDNVSLYKRTVATATGTFSFSGVPPGRYKLYAWERIPDGAEQSREFMEALSEGGTEIAVSPREIRRPLDCV